MKNFFFSFFTVICLLGNAQELKPVAQKIENFKNTNGTFEPFDLFSKTEDNDLNESLQTKATDATLLEINNNELQKLLSGKPQAIEFSFYYDDEKLTVQLLKTKNVTEDFKAYDQDKNPISYDLGAYYQGVISNKPNSLVGFSFFKNNVIAVASSYDLGNIVLGKVKGTNSYMTYADHNLLKENSFYCSADELKENKESEDTTVNNIGAKSQMTTNCVRVYYEIAYAPYVNNNSDNTQTLDWITAIHNNIASLYTNDNIQIALSEVMIWNHQDPYQGSHSDNLSLFSNIRTGFNGDLAHLVNYPSTTSVAYLNSLCTDIRHAYSGIDMYFANVPTYSWTIMAMTHEMGRSLGSPHTHACSWNGNGTAIDGCGPNAGFNEGCNAPLPNNGGTIMSYCHLVSGVGVNLTNGFGVQPATLIQNTVDSKSCLGTDCITSECYVSIEDVTFTGVTGNSATINIIDNNSAQWYYNFYLINSNAHNWMLTSNQTIQVSQLQPNSFYVFEVMNICANGDSFNSTTRRILLTGDYCNGTIFTDTGGSNNNYGNNEYLIKTFYPGQGENITLTFNSFNLEIGYDFMTIYNGDSTNDPIFPNGNLISGNTIPGPFTSTHPSGAITVKFVSDGGLTMSGWNATIDCKPLSINIANLNTFSFYPNPTSSLINITSEQESIKKITIYDTAGRMVKQILNIESLETSVNLEELSNGVYFINVTTGNSTQTKQLIKN